MELRVICALIILLSSLCLEWRSVSAKSMLRARGWRVYLSSSSSSSLLDGAAAKKAARTDKEREKPKRNSLYRTNRILPAAYEFETGVSGKSLTSVSSSGRSGLSKKSSESYRNISHTGGSNKSKKPCHDNKKAGTLKASKSSNQSKKTNCDSFDDSTENNVIPTIDSAVQSVSVSHKSSRSRTGVSSSTSEKSASKKQGSHISISSQKTTPRSRKSSTGHSSKSNSASKKKSLRNPKTNAGKSSSNTDTTQEPSIAIYTSPFPSIAPSTSLTSNEYTPVVTSAPTETPSRYKSPTPTWRVVPQVGMTDSPTSVSLPQPTIMPSSIPTLQPSSIPTLQPSSIPTLQPQMTYVPTSKSPRPDPSESPSASTMSPSISFERDFPGWGGMPVHDDSLQPTSSNPQQTSRPSSSPTPSPTISSKGSVIHPSFMPSAFENQNNSSQANGTNANPTVKVCRCDERDQCLSVPLSKGSLLRICLSVRQTHSIKTVSSLYLDQPGKYWDILVSDGIMIRNDTVAEYSDTNQMYIMTTPVGDSFFLAATPPPVHIKGVAIISRSSERGRYLRETEYQEISFERLVELEEGKLAENGDGTGQVVGEVNVGETSSYYWVFGICLGVVTIAVCVASVVDKSVFKFGQDEEAHE